MKEITKQQKRKTRTLNWLLSSLVMSILVPATIAQTVTLTPTVYGTVNTTGVQVANSLAGITTGTTNSVRGWFKFDLSSVPTGATITSANLIYSTAAGTTNSNNAGNQLDDATDDISLLTGTTLYGRCVAGGATTNLFTGSWGGTHPLLLQTNGPTGGSAATATALLTYVTGQQAANYACFTLVRGSTNTYNFAVPQLVINYTGGTPCAGTPAPGNTLSTATSVCAGTNFTLSLQNHTLGSGVKYQWMSSSDSITYTNLLNDTLNTLTLNATVTGTTYYQCVVTCSGSSGTSNHLRITVNPSPIVTVNSPGICRGTPAILIANGATTYTWSAGATVVGHDTATANPNNTTTYTVTGTSAGCSGTATSTITVTRPPTVTVNSATICPGQSVTLVAPLGTGTTGTATYSWSIGATIVGHDTATVNPTVTTTYTVTATIAACFGTAVSTITVNPLPVAVNSPTICIGGTATLIATGGTTYTWSAGATVVGHDTATAAPTITATYTVTGTSGVCSNTAVATVTVVTALNVAVNSPTICAGQPATLTASGANTYVWSAGVTSTGATTATATPTATTSYTVTGTSGTCSNTAVATVTVNPSPTVTVNSPTICRVGGPGTSATLTANGATTYTWSGGATSTGVNTATVAPFNTTTYTVTGTAGGCSSTAVATVTVATPPAVTVNSPAICTGQTATLVANSTTTGLTYTWSAGATFVGHDTATASPTTTATYTVTGTSAAGCTGTAVATVHDNSPNVTVNTPTICIGGTATLVASGATTYTWSAGATSPGNNDTAYATPASTATYTVSGTSTGCTTTAVATVNVVSSLSVIVNSPSVCAGQSVALVASGANTYTWSAGATSIGIDSATVTPTTQSTYTVTGSSGTCSGTAVATVTIIALPTITINSPQICRGTTATLLANGGTTYTWSNGVTPIGHDTATARPNNTSTYTVTGTANGCSSTAVSTVTVSPVPFVTVNSPTICSGTTATLLSNSTTNGVIYSWSAGATFVGHDTATAAPTTTATYTVTGTAAGCSGTAVSTVHVNPTPVVTVNSPTVCTAQTALLIAGGATTYTWSTGVTPGINDSATVVPTGTASYYTVTGTTGTCSSTAVTTVTVVSQLTVTVNSPLVCAGQTANLVANGANTYTWSTGLTSTGINTATILPTGTATYTVTGASGTCSGTAVATVTLSSINRGTTTNGATITADATGVTYQWINCATHTNITGATSQSYTATANGSYAVILNNGNCTDSSACVSIVNLGVNQLTSHNGQFSISPNPFTEQTTIMFGEVQHYTSVKIIDILGNEVKSIVLNGVNNMVIEKGDMHAGIYFIQITDEYNNVVNRKVIVN